MVVKGIRYGETWGMGCGPVFGPTFVEVMACDKEGNSTFVVASILESDLKINISDYPLFDIVVSDHVNQPKGRSGKITKYCVHVF